LAGELKHSDVGPELTYDEYHASTSHTIDGVDAGTVIAGKATLAEVKADTDVADAISKKHSNTLDHANTLDHTQGTDQGLDTGGANAVTAAEVKGAVTNSHAPGSDNQVIPDQLSDLSDDSTHRLVTDTEKSTWNAKSNLALGETETTAYRGDRGKTAYDHSQVAHAPSTAEANVNADWTAGSGDAQILNKPTIPDELADLSDDSTHRLVTDTEKSTWNGKTDLATVKADTDIASAISLKHAAVTLGTANGLSLSTQELSLAAATSANAGAATATQISKLDGIEALADVTDATNVASAGAVMESDTTTASMSFVIDEDDMASNLDTKVPTQQSVKAYVDGKATGTDDVARDNIVILAWKLAIAESLSLFGLEDGVVDEFEDETGIDTTASENESYDASGDYYSPAAGTTLDLMEYASDTLAQAAYVDAGTYTANLCTGGTPYANGWAAEYDPAKAFDDNTSTLWAVEYGSSAYGYIGYHFAVAKRIERVRILPWAGQEQLNFKNFSIQGSNDTTNGTDGTWIDIATGLTTGSTYVWNTFDFVNGTAYTWVRLIGLMQFYSAGRYLLQVCELEMMENVFQSYSESTIKTEGLYSLKGIASQTASLNKTLTRTISSPIDLSGVDTLKFNIRASRTGSNIKIGIHDSGGTTTENTPNITDADTWQEVEFDLSGVADANKDAIDSIIITILNADSVNTFYIDDFAGPLENMTLISNAKEAEVEPTTGRFLALVEPVDAITLNTDLKGYISLDDGANYEEVTLTDEGYFDATKKIYAGNETLTDRDDKTMRQKITTHNNKNLKIHAWGMLWK